MARKLTDGQEAEVGRRYRSGETQKDLAAAYRVGETTIGVILKRCGVPARSTNEAGHAGRAAHRPSVDRLRALYLGPDQFSASAIAAAFGVSPPCVRRWLKEARIPMRGLSEQRKIEFAKGRILPPSAHLSPAQRQANARRARAARSAEGAVRALAAIHNAESHAKSAASRRRELVRPCAWCGAPVRRRPWKVASTSSSACGTSHASAFTSHRRYHPNAPRPLILQQITEAIAQHRSAGGEVHRTLPAKFGAPLGATDAEYDAWWGALDLDSLNDYEMTAYLDWDLDRKVREAGLQSGVSED